MDEKRQFLSLNASYLTNYWPKLKDPRTSLSLSGYEILIVKIFKFEFKNNLTQLCRRLARFELKIAEIEFDIQ